MALSDQVPTDSGFGAKTDGADVIADLNLSGKVAIITGGYSGVGLTAVRALAAKGVTVVVPVRTPETASANLAGLDGDVKTAPLDLADLASVRSFAASMLGDLTRLDYLINNAGIMACPEARVGPGWESQFGVNHMGHFALTKALLPLIEKTPEARVVALSSSGHRITDIRWDDVQFTQRYSKWKAYGQSKTANALFANALSRRLGEHGGLAFSVHPGAIFTPLQRHLPKEEKIALGWIDENGDPSEKAQGLFKTPEQGCATTLWAATSPKLSGKPGVYCEDCDVAAPQTPEDPDSGVCAYACDDESAERLWTLSEELLANA